MHACMHTKTSCKILHESYTILASWILIALTCPTEPCKIDARSSGFLHYGKNLAVSASSKIMMQDLLQEVLDKYYSILSA